MPAWVYTAATATAARAVCEHRPDERLAGQMGLISKRNEIRIGDWDVREDHQLRGKALGCVRVRDSRRRCFLGDPQKRLKACPNCRQVTG